jgi:hypothetical protein
VRAQFAARFVGRRTVGRKLAEDPRSPEDSDAPTPASDSGGLFGVTNPSGNEFLPLVAGEVLKAWWTNAPKSHGVGERTVLAEEAGRS